jgi:hypothetical protein
VNHNVLARVTVTGNLDPKVVSICVDPKDLNYPTSGAVAHRLLIEGGEESFYGVARPWHR